MIQCIFNYWHYKKPFVAWKKEIPRLSIIQKVDDFDFTVIRNTIKISNLRLKIVPTTQKMLLGIKKTIEFPYSKELLRPLLKSNGFIGVNAKIIEKF